jgi:hypothetical protein
VRRKELDSGEIVDAPSRYRCEVSALESVELWGKNDRRKFEITEAIAWLSDRRTGQAYTVELFEMPPQQADWNNLEPGKHALFSSFYAGLSSLGSGLIASIPDGLPADMPIIEVRLTKNEEAPAVMVRSRRTPGTSRVFDANEERHKRLIGFLESHPLVRQITLPNILIRSAEPADAPVQQPAVAPQLPQRDPNARYPVVGVIDGGVAEIYKPWIIERIGFLAPEHESFEHGSFISGLLVEGGALNPSLSVGADGCLIADLNLFPAENKPGAFDLYYPNGPQDFFDEVAVAVAAIRKKHGVRVFNLSLNVQSAVQLDRYSAEARRLDKIAEDNDVIFVISAGNLKADRMRREWPADDAQAAAILAAHRDDQLFVPAESVRNLSVAAINPPGLSNSIAGAPARYSRRGPGLKTGVKPDLCHVGGSGTACPRQGHGLYSRNPIGAVIDNCGTSFAGPLVARGVSAVEAAIEGEPSRETLMALALHHAKVPAPLHGKTFASLARQLIGFGQPVSAAEALAGDDHQITMLFSSRIYSGKMLEFRFAWPPSLVHNGKCRGGVRLTVVSSPTLDYRYGDEFVRVNIEAALQQENAKGEFKGGALEPTYVFFNEEEKVREANLIEHMFKWSPVKVFAKNMPRGRGETSNWRLAVNYLTRAGEDIPKEGIPLSILLTISDLKGKAPVFQEMRQLLQASNYQIADIRTAARVTPRT